LETPPSSPSSNREETDSNSGLTNPDENHFNRETSTGSSPSHISSDDDSRHSNTQSASMPFVTVATARQTISNVNRPTSANVTNGTAFKAMSISGNICPRCSKTVYSAEEIKAAGKVIFFRFSNSKILFLDIS
jgi:hypothetical protein